METRGSLVARKAENGPFLKLNVGKMWTKEKQAKPALRKVLVRPVFWCARRDLNPRPIDP